jgi:pentatricopeptide repeat protein
VHSAYSFQKVIDYYLMHGFVQLAADELERMFDSYGTVSQRAVQQMANYYASQGLVREVTGLISSVATRSGFAPDIALYNCLILALCRSGKIDAAYNTLLHLRELHVKPNAESFNHIAEACLDMSSSSSCCGDGDGDGALNGGGIDGVDSNRDSRYLDLASRLLGDLGQASTPADERSLALLVRLQCQKSDGEVVDMAQMLEGPRWRDIQPTFETFRPLLQFYASRGKIEEVCSTIEDMHNRYGIRITESALMYTFRAAAVDGALSELQHLVAHFVKFRVTPTVHMFNEILQLFFSNTQTPKWQELMPIIRQMQLANINPNRATHNILASIYAYDSPIAVRDRMAQMTSDSIKFDASTFEALITAYLFQGQLHRAHQVLSEMEQHDCHFNTEILARFMNYHLEQAQYDETIKLWNLIKDRGLDLTASACNAFIKASIKTNNTQSAIDQLADMAEAGIDIDSDLLQTLYAQAHRQFVQSMHCNLQPTPRTVHASSASASASASTSASASASSSTSTSSAKSESRVTTSTGTHAIPRKRRIPLSTEQFIALLSLTTRLPGSTKSKRHSRPSSTTTTKFKSNTRPSTTTSKSNTRPTTKPKSNTRPSTTATMPQRVKK